LTVACRATVEPATTEAEPGVTETAVGTGGGGGPAVTVIEAVPDFPETAAVIVAEPAATPLTTPLELTGATLASLVDQLTVSPVITLPF